MLDNDNKIYNVLYLDDDINISNSNLSLSEKYIIKLTIAHDYETARKLYLAKHFDAFLLDIELSNSRETGIEFAEELRTNPHYYSTPIIFVSMHTHYASPLLTHIKNSSFITKPTNEAKLIEQLSLMLNIPEYITTFYSFKSLIITTQNDTKLEITPNKISFIEANGRELTFQYIDGKTVQLSCKYGVFKNILQQIKENEISCLRQIHRSIIINIKQIKKIHLENHIGYVYLFADPNPKPLGIKYRCNLTKFITEE